VEEKILPWAIGPRLGKRKMLMRAMTGAHRSLGSAMEQSMTDR
jgi:hypothetical protein